MIFCKLNGKKCPYQYTDIDGNETAYDADCKNYKEKKLGPIRKLNGEIVHRVTYQCEYEDWRYVPVKSEDYHKGYKAGYAAGMRAVMKKCKGCIYYDELKGDTQ